MCALKVVLYISFPGIFLCTVAARIECCQWDRTEEVASYMSVDMSHTSVVSLHTVTSLILSPSQSLFSIYRSKVIYLAINFVCIGLMVNILSVMHLLEVMHLL